jgi:hypothetical protein
MSLSSPSRFNPGETAPGAHCTGGYVGPSADLDTLEKKKSFAFARNRTPTVKLKASRYTD